MSRVVHAACPHDCPDACSVLVTVEDGRATRIQGNPDHPVTRGFLCAKVTKYLDRVYSPDRLLYPMKRVAPKGVGGAEAFERITWDEALEAIASKFHAISQKFGSEAILPYSYGGTLGMIQSSGMDRRFFHKIGASELDRTICASAGEAGILSVLGGKFGTEPEQFRESRYIIAWGANIHGNNIHLWPFIEEARRNGAKLVVIDPYRTRTAQCADWHIAIRPGTDVALALGMMHVIIRDNLFDAEFVAKHTTGFDELKKRAAEYTPEKVSHWTGIAASDIEKLAREYATTTPAVIRLNYGAQRSQNGGMATRAICMLPCLTGSWQHAGGGLQLSLSGAFMLNRSALKREDLMNAALGRPARMLNMNELGKDLTNEKLDPPVKALFVYAANPAGVCPNHELVVKGLKREDLFTVVHEQFLTDTTDYADIVLPATTFLEHKELQTSYGHAHLQFSEQAIAPVGEARSNTEVFRALAERMGLDDESLRATDDQLIDDALATDHPWLSGIDRTTLEREHSIPLNVPRDDQGRFLPFANGFATASGKAEFYSEALLAKGLDPVATFIPPEESRHSKQAEIYPLELLARKHDNFLNTTFCNLPTHQKMERRHEVHLHVTDAAARGIADGDTVRLRNDRGAIRLTARVDGTVPEGVVAASLDWARTAPDGKNVNVLTSDRLTDMGGGATFYSALVEVEKL